MRIAGFDFFCDNYRILTQANAVENLSIAYSNTRTEKDILYPREIHQLN